MLSYTCIYFFWKKNIFDEIYTESQRETFKAGRCSHLRLQNIVIDLWPVNDHCLTIRSRFDNALARQGIDSTDSHKSIVT